MVIGPDGVDAAIAKALVQIRQICESAMKWDENEDKSLTDRAWLAKCILDILEENTRHLRGKHRAGG